MGTSGTGTSKEMLSVGGTVVVNCTYDVTVTKN
jgi:hypothetical protein